MEALNKSPAKCEQLATLAMPLTAAATPPAMPLTSAATPPAMPLTPTAAHLALEQHDQKRRSSSRSIKRKRFDDEIVEYSVTFQQSRSDLNRVGRPRTTSQTFSPPAAVPTTLPPAALLQSPIATKTTATTIAESAVTSPTSAPTLGAPTAATEGANAAVETAAPMEIAATALSSINNAAAINTTTTIATPLAPAQIKSPASFSLPALAIERPNATPHHPFATEKRQRAHRSGNKRTRRAGRPPNQTTTKDLGRWKPIDDLALIIGIQQTNDLRMVLRGIKFSSRFTLQELQTRWCSLLYEPAISRTAVSAMRNLHPELVASVQSKALFSVQEEELLGTIKACEIPKLEKFQELLEKHTNLFFVSRTAKSLQSHWMLLKKYQLLPDQTIRNYYPNEPMTFSDAEDKIMDAELNEQHDEELEIELTLQDRQQKREQRLLDIELSRLNVIVETMSNTSKTPELDGQTLAVLRGRVVRYLMRSKEITFGRVTKECFVDMDFSLDGSAAKISRRQGTIKLRSNGDFFIANEGKRPLFINGMPLLNGNKARLANNSVVEISTLRFVFLTNYELINAIRHESAKTTKPLN